MSTLFHPNIYLLDMKRAISLSSNFSEATCGDKVQFCVGWGTSLGAWTLCVRTSLAAQADSITCQKCSSNVVWYSWTCAAGTLGKWSTLASWRCKSSIVRYDEQWTARRCLRTWNSTPSVQIWFRVSCESIETGDAHFSISRALLRKKTHVTITVTIPFRMTRLACFP